MTEKMTLRQANNVVKLINVLSNVKDVNFNYSSICEIKTVDDDPFKCGTVACAYGYMPNAFPNKFKWIKDTDNSYDDRIFYAVVPASYTGNGELYDAEKEAEELAAKELGMTDEEFYCYFMGGAIRTIYGVHDFSEVTRRHVIKALTKFINKNGYEIT